MRLQKAKLVPLCMSKSLGPCCDDGITKLLLSSCQVAAFTTLFPIDYT